MNIFEDLIEELKEENLIEETVIKNGKAKAKAVSEKVNDDDNDNIIEIETPPVIQTKPVIKPEAVKEPAAKLVIDKPAEPVAVEVPVVVNDADFYRKRAMDEVAFLQMVEAAFAGVERDQMKMIPKSFDDLEVKKVLHTFLNAVTKVGTHEHSQTEFQLLQATEGWYSSLAHRDKRIMTAHLRRYCETSRPPLSAPALIALARFYRNSPYTEQVRSKFDLMMTKIFSRESETNKREVVFDREELISHIKSLYAEWSSVPLYATEKDDAGILQTVKKFDNFMLEVSQAKKFDELINSNFFNRLRLFKEGTNEDFYSPMVAAVGIESNIHIGNRYVELLDKEKQTEGIAGVENKYGLSYDHTVSEATGKTMSLVELLKNKAATPKIVEPPPPAILSQPEPVKEKPLAAPEAAIEKTEPQPVKADGSKIWILVAAAVVALILLGIYFGTRTPAKSVESSGTKIELTDPVLQEYLQEAKINGEVLNCVALPKWNVLTKDQKIYALRVIATFGKEKGYNKVQLLDVDNKLVGTTANGEVLVMD